MLRAMRTKASFEIEHLKFINTHRVHWTPGVRAPGNELPGTYLAQACAQVRCHHFPTQLFHSQSLIDWMFLGCVQSQLRLVLPVVQKNVAKKHNTAPVTSDDILPCDSCPLWPTLIPSTSTHACIMCRGRSGGRSLVATQPGWRRSNKR